MSTTTAFTSNFQLKLIGTGRESGTWGASMNETLKRIESAMGKTVEINVESMPLGSTNADAGTSWTATWLTVDSANDGDSGAEGRARSVEFRDSGGLGANNPTVTIAGSSSGEVPARMLLVKNNLASPRTLTLTTTGASSTVTIRNGNVALVMVVPTATTGYAIGVHNILADTLQIGDVNFDGTTQLSFNSGANTIQVPGSQADALKFDDGTNDYLTINTSSTRVELDQNVNTQNKNDMRFVIRDASTAAFSFWDSTGPYIRFDTSNEEVEILHKLKIEDTDIDTTSQNTSFSIADNAGQSFAFDAGVGGTEMLRLDTINSNERVRAGVPLTAPDITITGTDGYLAFQSDSYDGTDHGIRNNSGTIEIKDSGGDWYPPVSPNNTSGDGTFYSSGANLALGTGNLVTGADSTQAHSLGSTPRMVRCVFRCTTAEGGYSIGDEVDADSLQRCVDTGGGGSTFSFGYYANATNVGFSLDTAGMRMAHATTGTEFTITLANWDVYIYAWK